MCRFTRCLICLCVFIIGYKEAVFAQQPKRTLDALLLSGKVLLDGKLTDDSWKQAPKATGFTQAATKPGAPSVQRTEVSVLYDDEAVYIGAMLYEAHPDSIAKQLSPRDNYEDQNTDVFGVTFDTYFDKQNATMFMVTAAGVQTDAIVKFDYVDNSWNSAWYSRVAHSDSGWSVEMKIPYSALRFSRKAIQQWGVNFVRIIRRYRERSYWNIVNPAVQNVIGQSGILNGVHDIKAPVRLALLPYLSAYVEDYNGKGAQSLNGGMDIKYGLSKSFTLDMTLVPDFGQTLFDNKVLNLSPIEVRYDERRYFFTEGIDLFNKNDLFYTRRVGGTPVNVKYLGSQLDTNEVVTKNPATTKLYNAIKLSGRTKRNTGIGFFNAVSAPTSAVITDTITNGERKIQTAPLTNYNVIVVDQALKNNSYISLVNTNVHRQENSYNANVSALLFKFANKSNRYGISGSTDVSQLIFTNKTDVGYRTMLTIGKQSGNFTWSLNTNTVSDHFNPNDLGYLDRNNIVSTIYNNNYNTYKPFWVINNTYNKIGIEYYRAFNPSAFSRVMYNGNHVVIYRSFHASGVYWDVQPIDAHDYYEPRTPGRYYVYPKNHMFGEWLSSNYSLKFAFDIEFSKRWYDNTPRNTVYWKLSPRYRFSNRLSAIYTFTRTYAANDVGFVNKVNDSIYLGTRNLRTTVNTLTAAYIFTRTMSLRMDARHYWSQAEYSKYGYLEQDGNLSATAYNKDHNINYNSFNVFMNFVWQFKPGSEMSVVYQNSIYSSGQNLVQGYVDDVRGTLQAPQSNSLSVKIIYYLDYLTIDKALHRKSSPDLIRAQ